MLKFCSSKFDINFSYLKVCPTEEFASLKNLEMVVGCFLAVILVYVIYCIVKM